MIGEIPIFSGVDGYGCFRQIEFLPVDKVTSAWPRQFKLWLMGGINRARSSRTVKYRTTCGGIHSKVPLEMRVTPNYDPNGIILHVQTANLRWMTGDLTYKTVVGDLDVRDHPTGQTIADYIDDYNEWRKDQLEGQKQLEAENDEAPTKSIYHNYDHKRRFRL